MTKEQIKKLRDNLGASQAQLAETLNAALGKKYRSSSVSAWELGTRPVPEHVAVFLAELGLSEALPPRESDPPSPSGDARGEDTTPEGGEPHVVPLVLSGNPYAKVCEDLWQLVATGVGMVGAVTGSAALRQDGIIIDARKKELGRAYGKLAETNETFRNMISGMTTSSAWLEVSLVTGQVVGEMWRNHSEQRVLTPVPDAPAATDLHAEPFAA